MKTTKFYSILLCTCLFVSLVVFGIATDVQAATESDLSFKLNSGGQSYFVYDCKESASGKLAIPATYNGKPVTAIGWQAFYGCKNLTDITIPNSVTTIRDSAFAYCTGLDNVSIPDSVTTIGHSAFHECNNLRNIAIPHSVTNIAYGAFSNIPCHIQVDTKNPVYCSDSSGILYSKDKTQLLQAPNDLSHIYDVRDGVTTIGSFAFLGCYGLLDVTIPDSVTTIGHSAFWGCTKLVDVSIPDSVTAIEPRAFAYCTSLTSITIPRSVTTVGGEAFYDCANLETLCYEGTEREWAAITDSKTNKDLANTKIIFNYKATKKDFKFQLNSDKQSYTLAVCSRSASGKLVIPATYNGKPVTEIGSEAFWKCENITDITIPDSVATIGSYALAGCTGLTNITIPDSVTTIYDSAFRGCTGLTSITIPNSVTEIRSSAFRGCTGLTSITICRSVAEIGGGAFLECNGLETVYYEGTEEEWAAITIKKDNEPLTNANIIFNYKIPDPTEPAEPTEPTVPNSGSTTQSNDTVVVVVFCIAGAAAVGAGSIFILKIKRK